jgi:tetratricopeptide (TPR) repeat protein
MGTTRKLAIAGMLALRRSMRPALQGAATMRARGKRLLIAASMLGKYRRREIWSSLRPRVLMVFSRRLWWRLLTIAAAAASVVALVLLLKARLEEINDLLVPAEEALAYRDASTPLTSEELRAIKDAIDRAHSRNSLSAQVWALGGLYQIEDSRGDRAFLESALRACEKSLRFDREYPLGRYCRSRARHALEQYPEALDDLMFVIWREPRWANAWHLTGHVLWHLQRIREAELALLRARSLAPESMAYSGDLAFFFIVNDRLDRATDVVDEMLAAFPDNAAVQNAKAVLSVLRGSDDAITYARSAVELAPKSGTFQSNLALILNMQGLHEEALGTARVACGLAPGSPVPIQELVIAAIRTERYDLALAYSSQLTDALGVHHLWVKANHYALTLKMDHPEFGLCLNGEAREVIAFVFPPPVARSGRRWGLDRFHERYNSLIAIQADNELRILTDVAAVEQRGPMTGLRGAWVVPHGVPFISCEGRICAGDLGVFEVEPLCRQL